MKLIELAKVYNCKIITNDFNLNKVAHVRGVEVLNINELANSLKPIVLPGELMRVFILKEGKEYNQGVAYLDDGTMVVVDNARRMISKTIDISVTSVLQTTAGKMIFGKYDDRLQNGAAGGSGGANSVRNARAARSAANRQSERTDREDSRHPAGCRARHPDAAGGTQAPAASAETTGTSRKQFMLLEGAPILVAHGSQVRGVAAGHRYRGRGARRRDRMGGRDAAQGGPRPVGRSARGGGRQHAAGIGGERASPRSIPIPISSRCTTRCGRSSISKPSAG